MLGSVRERVINCVNKFIDEGGLIVDEDWNVALRDGRYVAGTWEDYKDGVVPPGDDRNKRCACPLGAVLIAQDPRGWKGGKDMDAAAVLGVSDRWVASFLAGFDGGSPLDPEDEKSDDERADLSAAFAFGEEMREKHIREDEDDDEEIVD
jgi:hypothetical protein